MERLFNSKTGEHFDVPDEDFDTFQEIFSFCDTWSEENAIIDVECSEKTFSRTYTADEIKAIFWEDAELSGRDKEIAKNKVADLSDRRSAEKQLKAFIKKGTPITKKSAKTILKVLESFDSYECEIDD